MDDIPPTVPARWNITIPPDGEPLIHQLDGVLVATVHGSRGESLKRAFLIARAPALRDAAEACLTVFRLMQEHEDPLVSETAQDFIPVLESALYLTEPV